MDNFYDTQCPACAREGFDTAEDNLRVYDSGVQYCHVRHGYIGKLNVQAPKSILKEKVLTTDLLDVEYITIQSRCLTRAACEFAGYGVNLEKGVHVANYYNDAGILVMQQLRTEDKQFPIVGDKKFNKRLWGQDKHTPNPNLFITITEGQIDRVSVLQVFDCKYPVVSLPNGVFSAAEVLRLNSKYLNGFKYIVLAFDNDEPGKKATEDCLKLDCFEPGFIRVAKWRRKDANEHLIEGEEREIRDTIWNAVQYVPPAILHGDSMIERLKTFKYETKPWPFTQANKLFNAIKKPSVISVVGRPKRGKTEFMKAVAQFELKNGGNIAYISTEQSPEETFIKQVGAQEGVDLFGAIANRDLNEEELALCEKYKDRIVIYDHLEHGQTIDAILENVPYLVRAFNCEYLVLDNLSSSSSSTGGDERRNLDKAMSDLKRLTTKYNFTLWNVMHLKRGQNGAILTESDEDEIPDVEMIRGTQAIESYSDMVIAVHRDVRNKNIRVQNTLGVYCLADRQPGNKTGNHFNIYFNPEYKWLEDL